MTDLLLRELTVLLLAYGLAALPIAFASLSGQFDTRYLAKAWSWLALALVTSALVLIDIPRCL